MDSIKKLRCKFCEILLDEDEITNFFIHRETHSSMKLPISIAPGLFHTASGLTLPINKLPPVPDAYIPRIVLTRVEDDLLDAEIIQPVPTQVSTSTSSKECNGQTRKRRKTKCMEGDENCEEKKSSHDSQAVCSNESAFLRKSSRKRKCKEVIEYFEDDDEDYEEEASRDDRVDYDSDYDLDYETSFRRKKLKSRKVKVKAEHSQISVSISTTERRSIDNSIQQNTPTDYACLICFPNSIWPSIRYLGLHIIKEHKNSKKINPCPHCSYGTHKATNLHRHLSTHYFPKVKEVKLKTVPYHHICCFCRVDGKKGNVKWKTRFSYSAHMKTHIINGLYVCPKCPDFQHPGLDRINQHFKEKHNSFGLTQFEFKRIFRCRICRPASTFMNQPSMERHMVTHQLDGRYFCPPSVSDCSFSTTSIAKINAHVEKNHTKVNMSNPETVQNYYRCFICIPRKAFRKADLYMAHLTSQHKNASGVYKCPICDSKFDDVSKLSRHMEIHKYNFPLFFCRACIPPTPWLCRIPYAAHVNATHRQGGKLKCPFCRKLFAGPIELFNRHVRLSHKDKTFKTKSWVEKLIQEAREKWKFSQKLTCALNNTARGVIKVEGVRSNEKGESVTENKDNESSSQMENCEPNSTQMPQRENNNKDAESL